MNKNASSPEKRWDILGNFKVQSSKFKVDEIIKVLLENRGLKSKNDIEEFLHPKLKDVTTDAVGIDNKSLEKSIARIKEAIEKKEQIIVYGDYDVDGICGAAVLWETLHDLGAKVLPYIPHRVDEGYGLSTAGILNIKNQISNTTLIITVDNGIVANDAVSFANDNNIDVIVTDHHVPSAILPNAYAIVHTTKLCGTGVAYMLMQKLKTQNSKLKTTTQNQKLYEDNHLELVALATIADLVPLLGANRTLTKFGLEKLRSTKRVGLLALFRNIGLHQRELGTYEVGHQIGPRLNAMGRLESAMDSLRLICTRDSKRAELLAAKLTVTNRERQVMTEESVMHAKQQVTNHAIHITSRKLLFISHETYQQGVIGLIAGKLVEEFYRPSIVVSKGEKLSKASARSIHGLNIIEFIRSATEFLVDAGGHPMAAGFTVETARLQDLQEKLEQMAEEIVHEEMLTKVLKIDSEIDLSQVTEDFYKKLLLLAPFGMNNPEPIFVTRGVIIDDMRPVGQEGKHLKLKFKIQNSEFRIDGIAFGIGKRSNEFHIGDVVDIAYKIDENVWNGNISLQINVKDIKN